MGLVWRHGFTAYGIMGCATMLRQGMPSQLEEMPASATVWYQGMPLAVPQRVGDARCALQVEE